MVNRHQEAIQSHNTALSINQSINEPSVLLTNFLAHYYKSNMLYALGKFREGMNEIETGYERYRHILRPYHQIRAHLAFAYFHYQFGDLSELRRQSEQGYELARAMDSKIYELYFLLLLSALENRLGNLDKSYAHIQDIIAQAEPLQHTELIMRAYYSLGEIYLLLNDFPKAENAFRIGVAKPMNSYAYYQCQNRLVYALTFQGKINEAEKILHVIMDHELLTEMHGVYLESMLNQVNINFIKGKKEAASYIIEDLVEGAQKEGMAGLIMLAKFAQMQIAADRGQFTLVDELHDEISTWSTKNRIPWPHLTTTPFWLKFTEKTADEKQEQLAISRHWIAQLEPNCQSAALHESFIAAKSLWLPIVD
jgi:hypothetical protein